MTANTNVTISFATSGNGLSETFTITLTNTSSPATKFTYATTNGRTQINVPAGSRYALVNPSSTSSVHKTWDSGTNVGGVLDLTQPSLIGLPIGTTSVYIGADGAEPLDVYFL